MGTKTCIAVAALAAASLTGASWATSETEFHVRTTRDLVTLCSTPAGDPLATAAINFCEGFAVGAYQYHQVAEAATQATPLFCLPSPAPSRDQAIAQFVAWSKDHASDLDKAPIEGMFTFLRDRFPCH